MLSPFSRQVISRGLVVGLFALMIVSAGVTLSAPSDVSAYTDSEDQVKILLLLDHDYGGNVPFIINIFERYEWSITTTGLNQTLSSCDYLGDEVFTVDVLMTEISDVTQFDAISIMPGNSHDNLRTNQTSLDLINSAVDEGLVVSAWCRAVRVLAAADVIDGKNITGNAEYVVEYEAAGATFNELVPPIIDGNIVTGVRSRFYRDEMCQAIATAIGVFETDAPEFVNAIVSPQPSLHGTNVSLTVEFSDATGVYLVNIKMFALNKTTGKRVSDSYVKYFGLDETTTDGVFTGIVQDLELGNYTMDFEAWDLYMNEIVFTDGANLLVVDQITTPSPDVPMQLVLSGAAIGTAVIIVLVVFFRKR
ncbi:MAG: DJ-1/PfpI family protein [Candidatus Thorarchaeota archaeon]